MKLERHHARVKDHLRRSKPFSMPTSSHLAANIHSFWLRQRGPEETIQIGRNMITEVRRSLPQTTYIIDTLYRSHLGRTKPSKGSWCRGSWVGRVKRMTGMRDEAKFRTRGTTWRLRLQGQLKRLHWWIKDYTAIWCVHWRFQIGHDMIYDCQALRVLLQLVSEGAT